jgi:hypothetical protein
MSSTHGRQGILYLYDNAGVTNITLNGYTGDIVASGTVTANGLNINGNANITGTLNAGATTLSGLTVNGQSTFNGDVTINANLTVAGTTITGGLSVAGAAVFSGGITTTSLTVNGPTDLNGNVDIDVPNGGSFTLDVPSGTFGINAPGGTIALGTNTGSSFSVQTAFISNLTIDNQLIADTLCLTDLTPGMVETFNDTGCYKQFLVKNVDVLAAGDPLVNFITVPNRNYLIMTEIVTQNGPGAGAAAEQGFFVTNVAGVVTVTPLAPNPIASEPPATPIVTTTTSGNIVTFNSLQPGNNTILLDVLRAGV